ncbi:hypothetical protein GCM10009610_20260 [Pseudonocardia xinjiangensis]
MLQGDEPPARLADRAARGCFLGDRGEREARLVKALPCSEWACSFTSSRSDTMIWKRIVPNGLPGSTVLGVAGGDVSGDALAEPEPSEQPERLGQFPLTEPSVFPDR